MRILHIDSGRELRGGQHQVLLLMAGLRERGIQQTLLARKGSPLLEEAQRREYHCAPLGWWALFWLSRAHDLVHCHDARTHTMAALVSRTPFVVSRRVAFPVSRSLVSRWKYARARRYLSISKAVSSELVEAGIEDKRIALVPDGVTLPAKRGSRTGAIVALASDDPGKCGAMLAALPTPVEFVHDLETAFQSARMFVYASEMEGLGSAALLAMAYGVPVVASNVTGLRETVTDRVTGLLADNTVESFRAAIERLEHDASLAKRIAESGRIEVEMHYSADLLATRTLNCYREALGQ